MPDFKIGDRVKRKGLPAKHPASARVGTVIGLDMSEDFKGRKKKAAIVEWDDDKGKKGAAHEPYPFLFEELKLKGLSMKPHRRSRSRSLGALGEFNWKSPWLWGGLAALGLVMFWPKKAKAAQKPVEKAPDVPVGSSTGTEQTVPTGGATTLATDPGSGTPVAGPTGSIPREMKRTVAKGESWANIASRAYGDYRWWPALWDHNRSGGTKFKDPSVLRVGDEIMVPVLSKDPAFKAAVFTRAEIDRAWEIERARAMKAGKKFSKARPRSTAIATPPPLATLPPGSPVSPPPAGSGGMVKDAAYTKEPLVEGPGSSGSAPTKENPVPSTEDELDAMSREMQAELDARAKR